MELELVMLLLLLLLLPLLELEFVEEPECAIMTSGTVTIAATAMTTRPMMAASHNVFFDAALGIKELVNNVDGWFVSAPPRKPPARCAAVMDAARRASTCA